MFFVNFFVFMVIVLMSIRNDNVTVAGAPGHPALPPIILWNIEFMKQNISQAGEKSNKTHNTIQCTILPYNAFSLAQLGNIFHYPIHQQGFIGFRPFEYHLKSQEYFPG